MIWTEQQRETAAALWRDGRSAAFIAREFGPPVTRSAVAGLMHRLGIKSPKPKSKSRSPTSEFRLRQRGPRAPIVSPKRQRREARPSIASLPALVHCEPVSLLDAQIHHCRWPLGESRDFESFRFCGAATTSGSSYCAHHHILSRRPPGWRRSNGFWKKAWSSLRPRAGVDDLSSSSVQGEELENEPSGAQAAAE